VSSKPAVDDRRSCGELKEEGGCECVRCVLGLVASFRLAEKYAEDSGKSINSGGAIFAACFGSGGGACGGGGAISPKVVACQARFSDRKLGCKDSFGLKGLVASAITLDARSTSSLVCSGVRGDRDLLVILLFKISRALNAGLNADSVVSGLVGGSAMSETRVGGSASISLGLLQACCVCVGLTTEADVKSESSLSSTNPDIRNELADMLSASPVSGVS